LDRQILNALLDSYGLRVLHCATDPTDVLAILSLKPTESISSAASKLKGRVSKWLNEVLNVSEPTKLLSTGYFACTIGKTRKRNVEKYLESQATHHGYDRRLVPPVFVQTYEVSSQDLALISPKHAVVISEFHVVLATRYRKGIFGSSEGRKVSAEWRRLQCAVRAVLRKVSFLPDHVHIAVKCHPSVPPSEIVLAFMNSAQEIVANEMVRAGVDRLWECTAYVGSFGDLSSPQIRKYIDNWKRTVAK
jgi:REP element-mobilizing transposase RayT